MKLVYKKLSSFTADDIAAAEQAVADAQASYQKYLDDYNWGMQYGSTSYATRVRWPRVVRAQQTLETAQKALESMLQSNSTQISNDALDTALNPSQEQTTAEAAATTKKNYTNLAMAAGALLLVVIIYKLI